MGEGQPGGRFRILAGPLSSCAALGMLLNLSEPSTDFICKMGIIIFCQRAFVHI